jgi:hypothetical protein
MLRLAVRLQVCAFAPNLQIRLHLNVFVCTLSLLPAVLQDAMGVARNICLDPRLVPGGGAVEIAVSRALTGGLMSKQATIGVRILYMCAVVSIKQSGVLSTASSADCCQQGRS